MELQLKKLLLYAAASIALASCEDILEPPLEDSVDQRFNLSKDWNVNHPYREIVVQSDDYSILCVADSHVGSTKNLDNFFKIAKTSQASAVIMAGDLTGGEEQDYNMFQQHLPAQDSLLSFLTVGNHDLWSQGWEDYYSRFGATSYLFTVRTPSAADLFIALDSGSGTIGNRQLEWLKSTLQNIRPEYRRCILFTHNNFFRLRRDLISNPPVEELKEMVEMFTRHQVDMLLAGHDHIPDSEVFGVTSYIIVGALSDDNNDAGYLRLTVKNGNIGYTFENIK